MTYSFRTPGRSVEKTVRRIARDRLSASLAALDDPGEPAAALVHDLRKNIKRTRALLRLVRPAFAGFAAENRALRDAGRLLSDLRERTVLIQTFDLIAPEADLSPETLGTIRAGLVGHAASADPAPLLAAHRDAIAAVRDRSATWSIDGDGFDALSGGLERCWLAARKAMKRALAEPEAEALHLWRKRIKDHWYHATLLAPIWPAMMKPHIAVAGDLGETLGDARDLAFLIRALDGVDGVEAVRARAAEREARLLARARADGALLLCEPADHLSSRWRCWWKLAAADRRGQA